MKISVDVECTPEEARRFLGLPDMAAVHEVYLEKLRRTLEDGVTPDMMEQLMRSWSPMGDTGMAVWRQLLEQMGKFGKG